MEFDPEEPLYVATITPAIHYTMGGLKIDRQVGEKISLGVGRIFRGFEGEEKIKLVEIEFFFKFISN